MKQIAPFTCKCDNLWYYENGEIECKGKMKECSDYNFKYLVKETGQCTNSCPEKHQYLFNKECFRNCTVAKEKYQKPVKDDPKKSKKCVCEYLWERINNETVDCLNEPFCKNGYFKVNETNECVKNYPNDFPLLFNEICYKIGKCPEQSKEDISTGDKCICKNKWYIQNNGYIKCVNECPETHIFENLTNNECIQVPCDDYIMNYTCYKTCPKGTVPSSFTNDAGKEFKTCICDPSFGLWYRDNSEFPNIFCQINKCPPELEVYNNNNTKECLSDCSKYELYKYRNICYENECPNPTVSKSEIKKYECVVKKYSTASNVSEMYQFLKEEIVTLYGSDLGPGGLVYSNFSSTMQLYGINKGVPVKKDLILRSPLSYIDISSCSDNIFEDNRMGNDEDILVVKFDLESEPTKSLVNPVEYEFISSKTGQVLDASVYSKRNIIVSYSLSNILSYYKKINERKLLERIDDPTIEAIISEIQRQYKENKKIKSE